MKEKIIWWLIFQRTLDKDKISVVKYNESKILIDGKDKLPDYITCLSENEQKGFLWESV